MKVEYVHIDPANAWDVVVTDREGTRVARSIVGEGALVTGLRGGEPIFVLRAQDAAAMTVLNLYRAITEGLFDEERALALEADVQAFVDWRRANQAVVKDPD